MVLRLDALHVMHTRESNRHLVARPAVKEAIAKHLQWLDKEIAVLIMGIHDHIDADPSLHEK